MIAANELNPTVELAADRVSRLAKEFDENAQFYLSTAYQEAEVRKDFIDKFLFALGWDVNHDIQKNPFQQEVKVERSIQTATAQRRADYSLSIAPNFDSPVLYIEAKKPHADIATADNYFQTIRYANQRAHPIGILTDFEQLHVVDCRYQANIDTARNCSIRQFHYLDYLKPEKFAEIFFLFSRPAIYDGSLEKYAKSLPSPKGRPGQKALFSIAYKAPDERLLETLDGLRESLARSLKNKNPKLDSESLTELTQRVLDRLVLIRFLEDKLIEPDPIIPTLGEGQQSAWEDFVNVCRRLDKIYNGIVFKHHPKLDAPDSLVVDNKTFCDALDAFDYHHSNYLFADISIDILGSIYERFLGNVIIATEKRATLEPKPEVRKAGGVYYTPKYVVDYIVQNTVGKLIDGKTPGEISKMRFADIACGSGSFLLGAYGYLLKYMTGWYNENPTKAPKAAVIKREGALYLSLDEKSRILTDNIYGVDIDPQAVEVAQLSLYLKLLESETTASARQYMLDFHRPLLPSLANNIKCGNSLIGNEFYANCQMDLLGDRERKVNAFDWNVEFKKITDAGGFDVIVGNPPYIRIQTLSDSSPEQAKFLKTQYTSARKGNCDIYVLFMERAATLIKKTGRAGFILPNKFFTTDYGEGLRRFLSGRRAVENIVDFKESQVFANATTYTCLMFLSGSPTEHIAYSAEPDPPEIARGSNPKSYEWDRLTGDSWSFESDQANEILAKMRAAGPTLLDVGVDMARGSSSGADGVYTLNVTLCGLATKEGIPVDIEEGILRTPLYAENVRRYGFSPTDEHRIIFPYTVGADGYSGISLGALKDKFPKAYQYLLAHKSVLTTRKQFSEWWLYSAPRSLSVHDNADLLVPLLANGGLFCMTPPDRDKYCLMASGGFSLSVADSGLSRNYLLAILNSRLAFWLLKRISNIFKNGWITCTKQYVGEVPIALDGGRHERRDRLIALVDGIVSQKKKLPEATTEHARVSAERRIVAMEREIDHVVYDLYGLSEAEAAIVEAEAGD